MLPLIYFFSITIPVLCSQVDYTGYKLLEISPSTPAKVSHAEDLVMQLETDIWRPYSTFTGNLHVLVSPENYPVLTSELLFRDIDFTILNDDVQKGIEDERRNQRLSSFQHGQDFQLDVYHPFREILKYLFDVEEKYPQIAKIEIIGKTFENNPILGLKIGSGGGEKPAILIDACYHAREWVAPATALYVINQLVSRYNQDTKIREFVDTFDWHIFPVMNPDGYRYTWETNRLWRKNRSPASDEYPRCVGVDLNRNFPIKFGGAGTSNDSCSKMYPGPAPFSEYESQATRDFILKNKNYLKTYVTLHSYSQLWMAPYSYTKELPPDYKVLKKALDNICPAVKETHGKNYTCGGIADVLYYATGTATDWAYIEGKILYSFVVEERDTGKYGFLLPQNQIIPTSEEVWAGIIILVKILMSKLEQV